MRCVKLTHKRVVLFFFTVLNPFPDSKSGFLCTVNNVMLNSAAPRTDKGRRASVSTEDMNLQWWWSVNYTLTSCFYRQKTATCFQIIQIKNTSSDTHSDVHQDQLAEVPGMFHNVRGLNE